MDARGRGEYRAPVDDVTWIRGTLEGRLEDFEALVERYQGMLYAFVRTEAASDEDADEIVLATFFRAWEALPAFRYETSFRSWLHEIALGECRRRRSRRPPAGSDAWSDEESRRLRHELGQLSRRARTVLALRIFSDLPFREIARIEGVSVGVAKRRYHGAVTRLARWLR